MPRRRAEEPRDRTVLLRLTSRQMDSLESVAHLARMTPNAYCHQLIVEHLATMIDDRFVRRDLENRAAFDARNADVTPLSKRRRGQPPPGRR